MSDEVINNSDLDESGVPLWTPTPALRGRLLLGAVAALAFGGLGAAGALAEQGQGQAHAFTAARVLDVASLIALAGVLSAYVAVGREVDSLCLRKSSWCALGVVYLWELLDFTKINVLPAWWDTLVLIVVTSGLVGLLIVAFYSPSNADSPDKNAGPASPPGSKAGWGGLGIALVFFAHVGLRLLVGVGIRGVGWEALVLLLLIVCTVGFFLRFAVRKIQLRDKLGVFSAFVGVAEILGLIAVGIFVAYMVITLYDATQQTNLDDKAKEDLEEYWRTLASWVVAGANLAWASLTALLFLTLWNRQDPDADWLRDLKNAEGAY